ncbi:MAG: TonB-dependent receptor [Paracoccus sp. (in: a-proteobacteria)]|uniref:TonB-dependent receptor n=1 Tax=Paracoccus sp. TaxID=267 RepID=UPI0026DF39FA|nr:TonB-dependent receptor [Paracoccus sp. (in: a-proteobacteria)]MDO5622498.1 TonB-dependent receptor [Paracoccus sp. (in: a-proteobacteria)]
MTQPYSLRPVLTGPVLASAGVTIALTGAQSPVAAQQANVTTPAGTIVLDEVVLTGETANNNSAATGISRLPETVRETPKLVNVVPEEIIREQAATTLEETLRNVPGITLSTGEGRGGSSGDQFRIRGLAAQGDVYQDGLRDFGAYTHDTFNTEGVQVFKGPSGDAFGAGSLSGLVNQTTKRARLEEFTETTLSYRSGEQARLQVDTNRQLNETSALRANVMVQGGDVADRDHVKADRRGLALDWGTGIGTGTEWHLGYSFLQGRGTPDMGQPMAQGDDGIYRPLLEYGVPGYDRSTSYVRSTDRDDTDVHTLSSGLVHDMGNGLTLTNDTRLTRYKREFSASNPASCDNACLTELLAGNDQPLRYGAGGGMSYQQDGWGFQNVLAVRGEAQTGSVRHKFAAGLDLLYQVDHRRSGSWTVARATTSTILNPVYDAGPAVLEWSDNKSTSKAFNAGLFLSDRMSFDDKWSVLASTRLDYFDNSFDGWIIGNPNRVTGSVNSTKVSPSLSVIYEHDPDTMAYLTFSRTYRPVGTDLASAVNAFANEVAAVDLEPERSDLIELGGKMDLMDGRLGLTAAAFQIKKRNSFDIDPTTGDVTVGFSDQGQSRKIQGIELGASGDITDRWRVLAAYAWMDGEIISGPGTNADVVGNEAPGVAKHNLSLWTTYTMPAQFGPSGGEVTMGGGIRYASEYWADAGNTALIPETVSLDAMVSYEVDNWRVALNGYNLTDHDNYSSAFSSSRAVPSAGRTFALTLTNRF